MLSKSIVNLVILIETYDISRHLLEEDTLNSYCVFGSHFARLKGTIVTFNQMRSAVVIENGLW